MLLKEFLDQAEVQLETQLQDVVVVFQNLPEDVLSRPSSTNGWSIAECLAHLNSYAEFYLPLIGAAINKLPTTAEPAVFKHSFIGKYFINSMDPARSKKKFKAMKRHRPSMTTTPHVSAIDFAQHLETLLELIKQSKGKNLQKLSVTTSISSWIRINPGDAIQFLLTHHQRHLEQARRNL